MEKDKWIETVLNSVNGIQRVTPDDLLFSKIENKIKENNKEKSNTYWMVAASITLLLSLSFIVLNLNTSSKNNEKMYLGEELKTNNQLYSSYE